MNVEIVEALVITKETSKGTGVFANCHFAKGEIVVIGRALKVVPSRTIYSLQMDFDVHIDIDAPAKLINHSCSPNTGVRNNQLGGYDFVALTNIASGEEITFDYETTEYMSIAVPKCLCSSANCRGRTRGFYFLTLEQREKYGEYIANYLKKLPSY